MVFGAEVTTEVPTEVLPSYTRLSIWRAGSLVETDVVWVGALVETDVAWVWTWPSHFL